MDDTWRSELAEFIRIPSVSADAAHREDVKNAGEWVCDFIRSKCGGTANLTPFGEKELRSCFSSPVSRVSRAGRSS